MQPDDDLVGRPLKGYTRNVFGKPVGTLDRLHLMACGIKQVHDEQRLN